MGMAVLFMYAPGSAQAAAVLSAFFFGYPALQIFAGSLAAHFGPKKVLLSAVFVWSGVSLLIVPFYWLDVWRGGPDGFPVFVFFARFLVGVCEGVNFPAQTALISSWIPHQERSRAWAWSFAGESVGTVLAMLVCPLCAELFGWPSIFYLSAGLGFAWIKLFDHMASDDVAGGEECNNDDVAEVDHGADTGADARDLAEVALEGAAPPTSESGFSREHMNSRRWRCVPHPRTTGGWLARNMNDKERHWILQRDVGQSNANGGVKKKVPWCKILSNIPFTVNYLAHTSYNWGWYLSMSVMPSFYEESFHIRYDRLGFLSVMPYLALVIATGPVGYVADSCIVKGTLSRTAVRRIWTLVANAGQSACFVLLAILAWSRPDVGPGTSFTPLHCCMLLSFMTALGAFTFPGFIANYQDLSPNKYDAHLMSIGNSVAALSGIFGNYSVAAFKGDFGAVFLLAAFVQCGGMLPYLFLAKGEPQRF
eukprot:g5945.t1